jgi:hypothetical protein
VFVSKHALALAHANGGGKCKRRVPYPEWQWRAPQAVCTSVARKIRVPLVARQRRSLSALLFSLPARSAWMLLAGLPGLAGSGQKEATRLPIYITSNALPKLELDRHLPEKPFPGEAKPDRCALGKNFRHCRPGILKKGDSAWVTEAQIPPLEALPVCLHRKCSIPTGQTLDFRKFRIFSLQIGVAN